MSSMAITAPLALLTRPMPTASATGQYGMSVQLNKQNFLYSRPVGVEPTIS